MTTPPSSLEERMARLEGSYEQIDRRLGTLEQDVRGLRSDLNNWIDRVDRRFGQIESQIDQVNSRIDTKIDQVNSRIDEVNNRIDRVESRIDRLFYWQLGLMGAIAASILTTILTRLL